MPKKSSKKPSPKPTKARREATLAKMVKDAKHARSKNKTILQDIRKDPGTVTEIKDLLCADLVRVSEIPRAILGPSSSRQRYRELGNYSCSLIDFLFGIWAEFQRKAGLAPTLATRTVLRNISKTSRAQDLAHYSDEHVTPWNDAYTKLKIGKKPFTMLIASDFHSRFCNPFALRVMHDINKKYQPNAIRANGDVPDFPSLSTHRQFPGHFPWSVQDEINFSVNKVFRPLRRENPEADIKYLLGNHDVRLITAIADKGPMFASLDCLSFAELFKLDELQIGLICRSNFLHLSAKQRGVDIAQNWETLFAPDGRMLWTTVHGWLCGKDAPRKHVRRFMTNGTNGHLHDRQAISEGSYSTGVLDWYQTPCMAHPAAVAAGYIHGPVSFNAWSCGGLFVTIFPESGHVHGEFFKVGDEVATFRDQIWTIRQHERDEIAEMLTI